MGSGKNSTRSSAGTYSERTSRLAQTITAWTCIQEESSSYLGGATSYLGAFLGLPQSRQPNTRTVP
jgi:hypothetical protein